MNAAPDTPGAHYTASVARPVLDRRARPRMPEPIVYKDRDGVQRLWGRRPTFRRQHATCCPRCGSKIEDSRFFLREDAHKCREPITRDGVVRECGALIFFVCHVPAGHGAEQPELINIGVEVTDDELRALRGMSLPDKLDYLDAGYGDD